MLSQVRNILKRLPKPREVTFIIDWGVVKTQGTWIPSKAEEHASWDLYIELATRISVVELPDDQGVLREALSSLHSLVGKTREVMHTYGNTLI